MKEIDDSSYDALIQIKDYYYQHMKDYRKLELTKKDISKLRKKITLEKKESYTNQLRIITTFQDTKEELLRLYVNKIYLENFS